MFNRKVSVSKSATILIPTAIIRKTMKFTISIIILLNSFAVLGQVSDYGSKTESYNLSCKDGQEYMIKVTLPRNYDSQKEYKTLYYLDSWWLSELVLGAYAILNLSEKIEDVVLIGISLNGNLKDWNIQRIMDFTPSEYNMGFEMKAGKDDNAITLHKNNTGGADIFIEFIETKIFKLIELNYPNFGENRALMGHSYGGLFSFYTIQQKPQLFSSFIIISPSLWWNNSELLKKELFYAFEGSKISSSIYLCYGKSESKLISESNLEMDIILSGLEKGNLDYQFKSFNKINHNSILPQGIYEGLLYVYRK